MASVRSFGPSLMGRCTKVIGIRVPCMAVGSSFSAREKCT